MNNFCLRVAIMVVFADPALLRATPLSTRPYWGAVFAARLDGVGSTGTWLVDDIDTPTAAAHVVGNRVQLFRSATGSAEAAIAVGEEAAARASADAGDAVSFAALERALVAPLSMRLTDADMARRWVSPCGLWTQCDARSAAAPLPSSALRLRALAAGDAARVDACWEYRSERSLPMIRRMIDADIPGCLAADEGEGSTLQGWILRYVCATVPQPLHHTTPPITLCRSSEHASLASRCWLPGGRRARHAARGARAPAAGHRVAASRTSRARPRAGATRVLRVHRGRQRGVAEGV